MTADEQIEFQKKFGSREVFEAWMENAMKEDVLAECPWEEPGAKQPEEYTWAEFEALSGAEQIAFQNALGQEAFEAWMEAAQNRSGAYPWEEPGAKEPEEYTWAEFEALSGEHQIAFQRVMGVEAFEAWMNRVNP